MFWESIRPFFVWSNNLAIADWVRQSRWAFAWLEVFHLFGLTVLLGTIVMLSLRLMSLSLTNQPLPKVARMLAPWTTVSMAVMLGSGGLMFASDAMRYYASGPFRVKMTFLFLAIVIHFTIFRKATRTEEGELRPWLGKVTAIVALAFWIGVAAAGRAIAFF